MTRDDVLKLFPEATDDQITNLLNQNNSEVAKEKNKASQYKAKADKADELQTQLDELQTGNMTELEKANKALETANQQIATLQKDKAVRDLRESAMSDFGITAEQAKTVVKEDGSFDTAVLGKIMSDKEANAIAEYEKNALKGTPNPNNGGNNNEPDSKPADVANAEQISFGTVASAESQNSYVI
jgi:hypothetical protein